ncbi:MAG TPA: oligosaccharide flippase family protein, partial [Candidatus Kapabacteria bacterium]|nr:oligosaccharide flippase family protein [Candidatus Kapabacteria bacterium]
MIAIGASPILTRLYSPEAYGVFALMLAFVTFALALVSFHYEMAIALPAKDQDAASLTILALGIATAVSVISVFLFAPWGLNLLGRFGYSSLLPYWPLLPITILAAAFHQALQLWHLRHERYRQVASNAVVLSLTLNVGPIILGFLGFTHLGLLLGLVAARCVSAVGLLIRAIRLDLALLSEALKTISKVATEYRTFPAVGLPGAVLHIACFQLPAFLLASFYGAGVTGFYLLQDRV